MTGNGGRGGAIREAREMIGKTIATIDALEFGGGATEINDRTRHRLTLEAAASEEHDTALAKLREADSLLLTAQRMIGPR